ncbi:MAG: hypothetical protein ACE5R6_16710 [Candidatus Heimdallarchaeota archaeon]
MENVVQLEAFLRTHPTESFTAIEIREIIGITGRILDSIRVLVCQRKDALDLLMNRRPISFWALLDNAEDGREPSLQDSTFDRAWKAVENNS